MPRAHAVCSLLCLVVAGSVTAPASAQLLPGFGKPKGGLPTIAVMHDELPPLANPAYGEVLLSGNEALLEPAWLIGSLRDAATGQILKWNNYLRPDAKPNVKLVTEPVFEGFIDHSSIAKAEWLSSLRGQIDGKSVAEVVVTRVSVTSVEPRQIDQQRLIAEIVQRLTPEQLSRYGVVIAYVDVAITATRFEHRGVEADFAGYGGRIGNDWYYKANQKLTEHRLVAISAPLQFAVTGFGAVSNLKSIDIDGDRPCHALVSDAIRQGKLAPEQPGLACVANFARDAWPIGGAAALPGATNTDFVRQLLGSNGGAAASIMSERAAPANLGELPNAEQRYAAAAAQRAREAQQAEAARQAAALAETLAARRTSAGDKAAASQPAEVATQRPYSLNRPPASAAAAQGYPTPADFSKPRSEKSDASQR